MFSVWETLFLIKRAMEAADYQGPEDRPALIEVFEAIEAMEAGPAHPQGAKIFNSQLHQAFGHQFISRVEDGRLEHVHTTAIEDGLYESDVDYTTRPL